MDGQTNVKYLTQWKKLRMTELIPLPTWVLQDTKAAESAVLCIFYQTEQLITNIIRPLLWHTLCAASITHRCVSLAPQTRTDCGDGRGTNAAKTKDSHWKQF